MEIVISKQVQKELDKLDGDAYNRIRNGLNKLIKEPPTGDIKPLRGTDGVFRLRIGKYRILYEYVGERVFIIKLGTRGDVYK